MAYIAASAAIAAGGSATPLAAWTYRTPQANAEIDILINATAAGLVWNFTTGSELIVSANTPVGAGGAAGVLPNRLSNEPIIDMVGKGDELVLTINNPTGGAITYNLVAVLTPKG